MIPERLAAYAEANRPPIDEALGRYLPPVEGPAARLAEAMRYSLLAPGKRLRPMLVLLSCELCGGEQRHAVPPACAIEMVHAYSLIHDDLPAMDDDDLRRGRPTCHKAFDEATAILAGDGLLTLAFDVLARPPVEHLTAPLIAVLARAAGTAGMLGGQMADMVFEGAEPTAAAVHFIHAHKTAALIAGAMELGAVAARADRPTAERLARVGRAIGLAFQIADDALDVEATTEQLGKTVGKDAASGKVTYPAVFGLAECHRRARQLVDQALANLEPFGERAALLGQVARYAIARKA